MSNSTGLWYTGQPLNCLFKWMQFMCTHQQHTETRTDGVSTHSRSMCLRSVRSFWVNNFDIRNTTLSFVGVDVWVKRKGRRKKSSLQCLVYVIYAQSAVYIQGNILTFQKLPCHFRNNWPVPCTEPTPHQVDFFSSTCNRAAKVHSLFACWQYVNTKMSAKITITLLCVSDWDLTLDWCHTFTIYITKNYTVPWPKQRIMGNIRH